MSMTPYRESAVEIATRQKVDACVSKVVLGGILTRSLPSCRTPGILSRLWHCITPGDVWTCRCGRRWVYSSTLAEGWGVWTLGS